MMCTKMQAHSRTRMNHENATKSVHQSKNEHENENEIEGETEIENEIGIDVESKPKGETETRT